MAAGLPQPKRGLIAAVALALAVGGCGSSQSNATASRSTALADAGAASPPTSTSPVSASTTNTTTSTTTTNPPTTRPTRPKPKPKPRPLLAGDTVVVNPGHNGGNASNPQIINRLVPAGRGRVKACDTTGTATDGGYSEAAFNLSVGLDLRRLLQQAGAKVVMTRTNNTGVGPCVNERTAIGNRAHAQAVLSIHADGAPASGQGFQVLYPPDVGETVPIYAKSLQLARAIHNAIVASRLLSPANYVGQDGYVVRDDLAGLNLSTRPAIFVELGNMRNATDAALQTSPSFREAIAQALLNGLVRFLTGRAAGKPIH
jgi:N-acetylmuramoyl-L-alanine amidase